MKPLRSASPSPAQSTPAAARAKSRPSASENPPRTPISVEIPIFPRWAVASQSPSDAHFFAGASLALLDAMLRQNPSFAGTLRQRLALKAAAACVRLDRLRDDETDLRDAEQVYAEGAPPFRAARLHKFFRRLVGRPARLDAEILASAGLWLEAPATMDFEKLSAGIIDLIESKDPLLAAANASAFAHGHFKSWSTTDAEFFCFFVADLVLAQKLGWRFPLPLIALTFSRATPWAGGKRPRADDPDWTASIARGCALAGPEILGLSRDLSRRSTMLMSVAPKLRTRQAGRIIELLLNDDCMSPARAAKAAEISDRAARRLFERLSELGAIREFSGRPNFRLFGL